MNAARLTLALVLAAAIVSGCGGSRVAAPVAEDPPPPPPPGPAPFVESVLQTVASGPAVVVCIYEGLARTTDGGGSWTITHPIPAYDLVADGTRIFAATPDGVFRSSDDGLTWEGVNAGLPERPYLRSISVEGATVVASVYSSGGVAVSSDLGDTWQIVDLPENHRAQSILVSDGVIYAATNLGNVLRSSDGGHTWMSSLSGGFSGVLSSLIAHDGKLFVAGGWPYRVLASTDGGVNWVPSHSGLPDGERVNSLASRGGYLFAGTYSGFFRSSDDGASWSQLPFGEPPGIGVHDSAELAGSMFVGTVRRGVYRSDDNGATWTKVHDVGTKGDPIISVD